VNDFDAVQLAEGLDVTPMVPQENHLMETQHVATILDAIHPDFDTRPASAGRGRVDIAGHRARVEVECVGPKELHERYRLLDRPEHLRRYTETRLGVAPENVGSMLLLPVEAVDPGAADAMRRNQNVLDGSGTWSFMNPGLSNR
jgi:hypothetical protein